jgi:hypothetical protein
MFLKKLKELGSNVIGAVKETASKAKAALVAGVAGGVAAVDSYADVAFDGATKSFSGTFELAPFYSAITIIIGAIAVVAAISLALKQFRRVG